MSAVTLQHSLERVVIIPRNGYVNRIQAWASAAILAEELSVPLLVHWAPEPVAPAAADEIFEISLQDLGFIDRAGLDSIVKTPHELLPRYLHSFEEQGLVVLAGHDQGEQVFMSALAERLNSGSSIKTLLIIAGGNFYMVGTEQESKLARSRFYRQIPWKAQIGSNTHSAIASHSPYFAIHLRSTDRSREAPTRRQLKKALRALVATPGSHRLFVAADTNEAKRFWAEYAQALGIDAWSFTDMQLDRANSLAVIDAMTDWVTLGHSQALIYSATSSFGEEAAVATGNYEGSVGITASRLLMTYRDLRKLASNAIAYLQRMIQKK